MKKRILALVMSVCMLISMMPASALASDHVHDASCGYAEAKACDHAHNNECGYVEAVEGAACGHNCADGACAYKAAVEGTPCNHSCDYDVCGYYPAIPGTPCDKGCSEDADGVIQHDNCDYSEGEPGSPCRHAHDGSCGYTSAVAGTACDHSHNDACGYVAAVEGSACTHSCADGTCAYNAGSPCTYVEPEHTHSLGGWHPDGDAGHYKNCIDCPDNYREETVPHSFAAACDVSCDLCGYNRGAQPSPHSYSGATCITKGTCPCGEEGDVDKSNHVGGTEVRDAKDASEFEAGYTGDTYCLGCGDKLAEGENIPVTHQHTWEWTYDSSLHWQVCGCGESSTAAQAHQFDDDADATCDTCGYTRTIEPVHTHSYSAATCTTPATCSDPTCGETTGDVDKSNHVGGTEIRDAKDASEFEAGYTGDTYCLGCGDKLADGQTIPATHQHSYTAVVTTPTCSDRGYTTYTCSCNDSYVGDYVDALGHAWGKYVSSDDGKHTRTCTADSNHHQTEKCSGSTATCNARATCLYCGATYGSLNSRNHSGGTEVRNAKDATDTEAGYTGDTYCKGCGAKLSSGEVIPQETQISERTDTGIVTFTPTEGLVLPEDAELVVEPHTPSREDLAFLLPPETTEPPNVTQEVNVEAADIQNHFASTFTGPGEVEYTHGELLLIDGKEYYLYPGSGSGKLQLLDMEGILYDFDGTNPPESTGTKRADFPEKDEYISINGAVYQVLYSERDKVVLYMDGKIVGEYHNYGALFLYGDDYHPDKVKERQQLSGTVTPGENPIDGLVSGKTYNVSVIGSNDISVPGYDDAVLHSIKAETEEEKAAKEEVERLKADMEAKRAALDQLDTNDPDHMEAWAAWDEAETAYKEALAELAALANLQSATVTQTFDIPNELVGRTDVTFVAVHNTDPFPVPGSRGSLREDIADFIEEWHKQWEETYGSEIGTVEVSENGQTLTATYTVNSFSPFTVYAFTEAELPEAKEFVTQPDGTLTRVVNGQPVTTHTVASGENLTVIARKYGCTVDEIVALNSDLIENPSLIYSGWKLTIPAA